MIRSKNKIHGELNDPNTVLASDNLNKGVLVRGFDNKSVRGPEYRSFRSGVYVVNDSGVQNLNSAFNFASGSARDTIIGTDDQGNIISIPRSQL